MVLIYEFIYFKSHTNLPGCKRREYRSIEYHFDIPPGGYQDEKEDTTIKPDVESAKPCRLCEHDNAKDNTCIYCNTEHRCWSRKR